jgi:hypothetical protein
MVFLAFAALIVFAALLNEWRLSAKTRKASVA